MKLGSVCRQSDDTPRACSSKNYYILLLLELQKATPTFQILEKDEEYAENDENERNRH